MVTPRYFTLLEQGTRVELIQMDTLGLTRCREMSSRVLLLGLIARPDEEIHFIDVVLKLRVVVGGS